MLNQNPQVTSPQTQNWNIDAGLTGPVPPPTVHRAAYTNPGASNTAACPVMYESMANEKFRFYSNATNDQQNCYNNVENTGVCVLALTNQCSPTNTIYGGYCKSHNQQIRKIYPFTMDIKQRRDVRQFSTIPITKGEILTLGILTSTLKIGTTPREIDLMLKHSEISSDHRELVCKFYSELSFPSGSQATSPAQCNFQQYMNILVASVLGQLVRDTDAMKNVTIQTIFSPSHVKELSTNKWFHKIQTMANQGLIRAQLPSASDLNTVYYIPLIEFNMLDIMALRSYYIDIQINQTGYAPNVTIINGQFAHGIGYGIPNAVALNNINKTSCGFSSHPENVIAAINRDHEATLTNLDVLTISAWPASTFNATHHNGILHPFITEFSTKQNENIRNSNYADIINILRNPDFPIIPPQA